MTKKKKKKAASKKSKEKKSAGKETKEEREARLAEQRAFKRRVELQKADSKSFAWQTQFSKVASLLQNEAELRGEEASLMPAELGMATSDAEFDAHKDSVVEKIQTLLSGKKPEDAVALFREARALWPADRELFGEAGVGADEEFEVFKNLFMRELEIRRPEPKEDKVGGVADGGNGSGAYFGNREFCLAFFVPTRDS